MNNIIFLSDYRVEFEENENLRHYEDGERCICWDCDEARRCPQPPDYNSLPLFKAMSYKP